MTLHTIEPTRETLHGCFSRELPAILTVDSGDTVRLRTLDAGWGLEPHRHPPGERRRFEPRTKGRDSGHALCGPIAIRGAEPGMVLEIRIGELRPGAWGWTFAGGWPSELNKELGLDTGEQYGLIWHLDPEALTASNQAGEVIRLRPFMGVLGMPPDAPGLHSTFPPRATGGNLDCRELVRGSTLFIPIAVPGGLLSVGDGHGAQGDGEVCSQAVECPMDVVELTLVLRDDLQLKLPRAHTPAGWITFGLHEDLNVAMVQALDGMLDLLVKEFRWERKHALGMASLLVDFRITQVVNGVRGVHAVLPRGAVARSE
jgi:acetamidase/formamidase